jgi:hypothetical protein
MKKKHEEEKDATLGRSGNAFPFDAVVHSTVKAKAAYQYQ